MRAIAQITYPRVFVPSAVSTVNYFSLASNLGSVPVLTTMRREGTRAIWYSRYIDWIVTTPMLLLVLLLATGLPLGDITTILACELSRFSVIIIPPVHSC
jgi:bacteriorhodopsin